LYKESRLLGISPKELILLDSKEFTERDKFGLYNGMEIVSLEKGRARARMEIKPHHKNGLGTVHGGAIFTLADLAFAAASNSGDDPVTSINATMAFVKAAKEGLLFAEAWEVTRGSKLVTYEARVTNSDGEIIAVFQGTGYIIKKPSGDKK
jgi:acyl-CoA thioesterase